MRRFIAATAALVLASSIPALARQQSGQPAQEQKPAPKPDAKASPSIAGKWTMALELEAFTATPALEFKQDGEKITGTYTGRYGAFPFEGKLKDRALAFAFKMNAEGADIQMSFTGEVAADGKTIKGRVTLSELGEGSWTAKREGTEPERREH